MIERFDHSIPDIEENSLVKIKPLWAKMPGYAQAGFNDRDAYKVIMVDRSGAPGTEIFWIGNKDISFADIQSFAPPTINEYFAGKKTELDQRGISGFPKMALILLSDA